ncbi:MAG TPA: PEGA domain-containing protein, partial [Polyangiaceae bacterium LLY-WYZ-15_(1-7)]|nr:PEGA domain-containing protein [Polyangiaceae bacterium LLY-WYZ-15_(1-7)]
VGAAAPVAAQSERELLQRAREAMERGQEAYLAQSYAEAAASFMAAYEAKPFSAFLYNAGIAYERNGDVERAIELYARYLDEEPDAADSEEVRERLARLRELVGDDTPDGTAPDGTTPDGTTPDGTTPDGTAPDGTTPDGTTPDGTAPDGTAPDGTAPDGTAPDGTAPDGTTPSGTGPAIGATPQRTLVDAPERQMKSLLSVETVPGDARVTLRQGDRTVATGPSPFAATLDEGEYEISVEHPDYRTVSRSMRIRPGKVYVAILEMSQGEFLGYLRVVTDPPGADVYIDDREAGAVGQTPFQNPVTTGEHHVWIERPGYETEERDVEVAIGEDVTQQLQLTRVTYGRIRIVGNVPGAIVLVDGQEVGEVPYEGQHEAGPHRITVRHDGMKDWEELVDIQRGQLTPIRVRLRPAVSRSGAWATASLGVIVLGGGIALGLLGDGLETDLANDRDAGRLADDDPRILRGKIFNGAANAAFGVAGLLGLLSLYYFVRDPLPDSEGTVLEPRDWTFVPHIDPVHRAGGAQLNWSF